MPDVSVIMPVYNRRTLMKEALQSALIEASEVDLEIVCVDDCSTDGSYQELQTYGPPVRSRRMSHNSGQSAARNAGIEAATGEFLIFLDSDDVLEAGQLARTLHFIRRTGADIVVSGWGDRWSDGRERTWPAPQFDDVPIVDALLAGRAVPTTAALYRNKPHLRWDPTLRKLDDWDFFVSAAVDADSIVALDGIAYWMREHGEPRATTQASMLDNARELYTILGKLESRLERDGMLTEPRRRRLAQYLYKELRVLALNDRGAFESVLRHIFELDPEFAPRDEERQWWMRAAAKMFGTRNAVLMHTWAKRIARRGR